MDILEGLKPRAVPAEPPHGPRSQGGTDEHYHQELAALLRIPSLSCAVADVDERAPALLRAVHLAATPGAAAYPQERIAQMFSDFLLETREAYRALRSPGKRPWPAFMQAAQAGTPAAQDCDAIYALTEVHVIGQEEGRVLVGDYLAGAPLDTHVLTGDGLRVELLSALPAMSPVLPSLKGAALARACHDTACRTRVLGASGHRRMTRDELISEVARRSAEITSLRKARAGLKEGVHSK